MESIILASASPRRRELLNQIGIKFEVVPSKKEEVITSTIPYEIVQELAKQKAEDIAALIHQTGKIVLGADTIVTMKGQIMGKPADEEDAFQMLSGLQSNVHQVYTGVAISFMDEQGKINTNTFYEATDVQVYPMTEEEIKTYIATKDPLDKAGGYGIQGCFAAYIQGIRGDYNNVVGLPTGRIYQELKKVWKNRENYLKLQGK